MAFNHASLAGVALLLWLPMLAIGSRDWNHSARTLRALASIGGAALGAVDQTRISALALLPAVLTFTRVAPAWFDGATLDRLATADFFMLLR